MKSLSKFKSIAPFLVALSLAAIFSCNKENPQTFALSSIEHQSSVTVAELSNLTIDCNNELSNLTFGSEDYTVILGDNNEPLILNSIVFKELPEITIQDNLR